MTVFGNLDDFLDGKNSLFLVRKEIDNNDIRLHGLDLVENPTVQSRIEIIELGPDLNLV